ncbi:MAG TPA: M56 family metallopeptidase [Acidimicrobiales bacterium]|nr:M56 family metallopeptidase [Acidimicrobiales bacterium]
MTAGTWSVSVWMLAGASVLFGVVGPHLAHRMRPRAATWILSGGSVLVAASSVAVPALFVVALLGQWTPLAAVGHWSAAWLRSSPQSRSGATAVALAVLLVQMLRVIRLGWRHGRPLLAAWGEARRIAEPLVVIPGADLSAFAVPGWPGCIVATSGLVQQLTPGQRRAVLAHEQAHLDAHHDLHVTAAELAAAVNPLMARVPAAIRLTAERWADEVAAASVSDRRLVAETIGQVAVRNYESRRRPVFALSAAGADVVQRVGSLLDRPPRRHLLLEGLLIGAAGAAVAASLLAAYDINHLFEMAERTYRAAAAIR